LELLHSSIAAAKQPRNKVEDPCGGSSIALGDKVQRLFLLFMMHRISRWVKGYHRVIGI